jgi:primosomal protein N' (replication factor Y)
LKYAEVIVPLPLDNTYTYVIPPEMVDAVQPNRRVIVPFGNKHYYTAIVKAVHDAIPPPAYALKEIFAALDAEPIVLPSQIAFWEWMASYYICKLGDVYKAAVPSGLKLESETVVRCNGIATDAPLTLREQTVVDAFAEGNRLTVSDLERIVRSGSLLPTLNKLVQQGLVTVGEELKKGFAPRTQTYIRLQSPYRDEKILSAAFAQLRKARQQEKALLAYLELAAPFPAPAREIAKAQLRDAAGVGASVLDGLVKRGLLEYYEKDVSRLPRAGAASQPPNPLTPPQQAALDEIKTAFATRPVCLLHGVPSCGKTEIYIHLAAEMLQQGKQVLYLLPEIALTTQMTARLQRIFGDALRVYHSGFSDAERVEVWNGLVRRPSPVVALGVRSSLFLPFTNLGLVIVDEEHEPSYKQQDPAPRYHARNAAVMLARIHGAVALLGSATPALDSFQNARTGKYGLVTLRERYGEGLSPQIHLVDTKELKRKKIMKDGLLSPFLQQKVGEALARDEQVILFRNRRGFAPALECPACSRTVHCTRCDVSLTFHKQQNRLVCHYCGFTAAPPQRCPACGHAAMKWMGFGTEKIEEEMAALFPEARTARLDLDSARTRRDCERILTAFEQGKTQILIGTQMVSKGLDFGRVTVVGVLNADSLMSYPDFRAHERAFQLMMQVSGRAGRRDRQGLVVIQTSQPEHPLLQMLQAADYGAMANAQLNERHAFRYPPYCRLITVVMRSRDEPALHETASAYTVLLQNELGESRVYGPVSPPVNRVQTFHLRHIILKLELSRPAIEIRLTLEKLHLQMHQSPHFRQTLTHYDVD